MKTSSWEDMLSSSSWGRTRLELRRLRWKLRERVSSRNLRRRKKLEELKRNTLKTWEMSFIYKNLRNKHVSESKKSSKREKESSRNCSKPKSTREDSKRKDRPKSREWRKTSRSSWCRSSPRTRDSSRWTPRREGWRSWSTRERLRDSGRRSWPCIGPRGRSSWRRREDRRKRRRESYSLSKWRGRDCLENMARSCHSFILKLPLIMASSNEITSYYYY